MMSLDHDSMESIKNEDAIDSAHPVVSLLVPHYVRPISPSPKGELSSKIVLIVRQCPYYHVSHAPLCFTNAVF